MLGVNRSLSVRKRWQQPHCPDGQITGLPPPAGNTFHSRDWPSGHGSRPKITLRRGKLLKKLLFGGVAAAALVAIPSAAAFADSCTNLSRDFHAPPPACFLDCTSGPITVGNWVWLPSIGVEAPIWGFAPPGALDSQVVGTPGSNGNYTNGQTSSLLGVSAICHGGVAARQQTSGIQTGCE